MDEEQQQPVEDIRVTVRVSPETKEKINRVARKAGLRPGNLMAVSLMVGFRKVGADLVPEEFITPETWEAVCRQAGITPEHFTELAGAMERRMDEQTANGEVPDVVRQLVTAMK